MYFDDDKELEEARMAAECIVAVEAGVSAGVDIDDGIDSEPDGGCSDVEEDVDGGVSNAS
jgi:hypothetical protein